MKFIIFSLCAVLLSVFFLSANETDHSEYFSYANSQMKKYHPLRKDYVIIIDYRKSILSERLYVLDMNKGDIALSSTVSHAWKSGSLYARKFSNEEGTNTSCKGNFVTKGPKYGKFGYSMIVKGLDKGINDKAESRAIIFHADTKMKSKWSWGCFATPEHINMKLIDLTKYGVLVCVLV